MTDSPKSSGTVEDRLEAALAEVERALTDGEDVSLVALIEEFDLTEDKSAAMELIYFTFVRQKKMGRAVSAQELFDQFPDYVVDLEELFAAIDLACSQNAHLSDDDNESKRSIDLKKENCEETVVPTPDVFDGTTGHPEKSTETFPMKSIGPYRLLQQIGRGGMGTVYMAEQTEPVRRRVALKLIRPGIGSKEVAARFEAERQALALMEHEHIAKVLDAGTTDEGSPYFVMELVQGIPITDYCDRNTLPVNERLNLFMQACRAIQHAHQKGIIHRDIKPSNVMVTELDDQPTVKVIDFGLAKALQNAQRLTDKTIVTEFGQVLGTLQYMSPEQAGASLLDVDTRADVYSLGILLYELLTGSTPIDEQMLREMALDKVLKAIRDEEPQRPSQRLTTVGDTATRISENRKSDIRRLSLILRGDLDWIAMKAIEKNRNRRYDNPVQLAEDVQRFLNSEAVVARPPSMGYYLTKAFRRHRRAISALTVFVISLVGGLATTSWLLRDAMSEIELKEDEIASKTVAMTALIAQAEIEQGNAADARKQTARALAIKEQTDTELQKLELEIASKTIAITAATEQAEKEKKNAADARQQAGHAIARRNEAETALHKLETELHKLEWANFKELHDAHLDAGHFESASKLLVNAIDKSKIPPGKRGFNPIFKDESESLQKQLILMRKRARAGATP